MAHQITTDPEKSLIHLVYSGTINLEERGRARDEVFRLSREQGLFRVLVDMSNCDIRMSAKDAVAFASVFRRAGLPPNYRLACIIADSNEAESLIESRVLMGQINIRYFDAAEQAHRWLQAV